MKVLCIVSGNCVLIITLIVTQVYVFVVCYVLWACKNSHLNWLVALYGGDCRLHDRTVLPLVLQTRQAI